MLLVTLSILFRTKPISADGHINQPNEYDEDYQYNDAEFDNYPDFGQKNGNVKLSTIKTVVQEVINLYVYFKKKY